MATCIRCGSELLPEETQCGRCGTAHVASDHPTPRGLWASNSLRPPLGGRERTPVPGRERTPVPGKMRRPPAATASALAVEDAPDPATESTGMHPTLQPAAEVVPFHPPQGTPASASTSGPRRALEGGGPAGPDESAEGMPVPAVAEPGAGAEGAPKPPPRPPVLASESLREDMEPTEPWGGTTRVGGTALALFGAVTSIAVGGLNGTVVTLALLLVAAGALCITTKRYAVRAVGVLGIAGLGLAIATTARLMRGAPVEAPVLAVGTVVLAGGLLFRSAYRASQLSRLMVALGMLAVAAALLLANSVGEFSHVGLYWQSWLHVIAAIGFGILLLLSLLAFMAPSTTGGTQVWGVGLLIWYALHVALTVVTRLFPAPGHGPATSLPDPAAGVVVGAAVCAVLAAVALAQTLAVRAGCTVEQRRKPAQ